MNPDSKHIKFGIFALIAIFAFAFASLDSRPGAVAEAADPINEFVEDFAWEGNHASTLFGGAGATVWWDENSWDARTDTSYNGAVAGGGNDHIDIHKSVDDLDSSVLINDVPIIGGDGSAGTGIMHVDLESVASARLRNPMLISQDQPGVVEFRTSNFVTTGHWWEVAIVPTDIVAAGEVTAVPSTGERENTFDGHPGAGHRPSEDSLNYISFGSSDVPCEAGWDMKNGVIRSIDGISETFRGPNIETDPSMLHTMFAWRLEYYPDRLEAYVDLDRDGIKEHHNTIEVNIPWSEVYVELLAVGYQAYHHPQDGDCGAFQGQVREIAWKDVHVSPVKYTRTSSYPKNEGTTHVPQNTGWMFYDLRDTQRFGPASANPPQANQSEYNQHTANAFCNRSGFECANSISSKTLNFNLPAQDATGITRAQLIYDIKWSGGGNLIVNGQNIGSMPKKSTVQATMGQDWMWAQRSIDVDPSLFVAGQNTIKIDLQGEVAFDRLHFEFAYGEPDETPPSSPTSLQASAVSDSQINLSWSAASDPESGVVSYDVYRNGSMVGNTPGRSYSDKGLNEDTSYTYFVKAINGARMESGPSSSVNAATHKDTVPPALVSVHASSQTTVEVEFSESVEQASATDKNNYSIGGLTISSASPGADLKTVTLTTSTHSEGQYTLAVSGVRDRANSPNTISGTAQKTYLFAFELQLDNLGVASGEPYRVNEGLDNGGDIYIDRSYTYPGVPQQLVGSHYIVTANKDKLNTDSSFITFDVNQDVKVSVAYDERLSRPAWLQEFEDMGEKIDIAGNMHTVLAKEFAQGNVALGANEGIDDSSMYTVIVTPLFGPVTPPSSGIDWLRVEGNKIVNESDETVVLRGVNIENREWSWNSTKSIDFERQAIPVATKDPSDNDGWGSNVILIAVASGPINRGEQDYLGALDEIVSIAKAEGAYTLMVYRYGEPNTEQAHFPDQAAEDAMASLAARYENEPAVLYGLQVEPAKSGSIHEGLSQEAFWDQVLKPRFDTMVAAIHDNNPNALIVVPGTQWGRKIHWVLDNPVAGDNLVYKTHPYDSWNSIQNYRLDEVADLYPVLIGEFGPGSFMSQSDVDNLLNFAEQEGMSWIAWLFHDVGCPCLLEDAGTFTPSAYGEIIKARLQAAANDDPPPPTGDAKVLVFHKTGSFVHSSTDEGVAAIHQLGLDNGFEVNDTIDSSAFTDANLAQYDAVVFLNTHQEVLDNNQQAAFERFIQAGGGYAGIHIASGTEYDWNWYGGLVGARFNFHPDIQQAGVIIEDPNHPSTSSLPAVWLKSDEWYNFFNGPDRSKLHILARVDESTYSGGEHGIDHPVAWCQEYDGGRSWYTAMGHNQEDYSNSVFLSHVLGGIQYASGMVNADCSPTPDEPPAPEPEIVSNISVTSGQEYKAFENAFNNGVRAYIDRSFEITGVAQTLTGSTYIMTANGDKQETSNPFLSFDVSKNVAVHVAYDDRLSVPSWLGGFSDTGLDIQIEGGNHSLFAKDYPAGAVQLGANQGVADSSMYVVIVTPNDEIPGPVPPVASFNASPGLGDVPLTVNFNASSSFDPDGSIVSYDWDFGDGSTASGVNTSHEFTSEGTFTIKLTVTDDDGETDTAQSNVVVNGVVSLFVESGVVEAGNVSPFPLKLGRAPSGLAGYLINVSLDSSAAEIVDVEFPDFTLANFSVISPTEVRLIVSDISGIIGNADTNVLLANLMVKGISEGTANADISVLLLDDRIGNPIEAELISGTITVTGSITGSMMPTLPGNTNPVQDLDGDGLAEDMNGNGALDFADLVAFFNNINSDAVQSNFAIFDFDQSGAVDLADVIVLFDEFLP